MNEEFEQKIKGQLDYILSVLTPEERKNFINYIFITKDYSCSFRITTIINTFSWAHTEEGSYFWVDLDNVLEETIGGFSEPKDIVVQYLVLYLKEKYLKDYPEYFI